MTVYPAAIPCWAHEHLDGQETERQDLVGELLTAGSDA